jgi:hypothetical protein
MYTETNNLAPTSSLFAHSGLLLIGSGGDLKHFESKNLFKAF